MYVSIFHNLDSKRINVIKSSVHSIAIFYDYPDLCSENFLNHQFFIVTVFGARSDIIKH